MKSTLSHLFRWQPSGETLIALAAGAIVVGLSALMVPAERIAWVAIAIRDIAQIFLVGILLPLWYMRRQRLADFGLRTGKWYIFIPINLVLGALLLTMFLSESPPPADFHLSAPRLWSASYVFLALCFELIFFYAFLRTILVRAFGFVPGVILTALFYAFHHIGFQPEYDKLIFVGLLYATTCQLGNSALLIFPFFLGVGGIYDVLIQSQVVSPIQYPDIRTLYLAALILVTAIWPRKKDGVSDKKQRDEREQQPHSLMTYIKVLSSRGK
ncbi:MAG: hypothetical protein JXB07_08185 [Anaerolineae bacterium]|nr:hypothetical protein [Anaerolineae bacterium]